MNALDTLPGPAHPGDDPLLARLRTLWDVTDPAPADLVDRCLVALAVDGLDLDLMLLQDTGPALAGARGPHTSRTLTFSGDAVSVMVTITPVHRHRFRLDGWVAPYGGGHVEVRTAEGAGHDRSRDVRVGDVDADGRFVVHDVPDGVVRFVYHPGPDAAADPTGAPPVPRPVAGPPIGL